MIIGNIVMMFWIKKNLANLYLEDITYTPAKKNSPLITNQKKFKDRLVHCYWALVFIIFYLFLYIFAGLLG